MAIRIRYFANLRELVGHSEEELSAEGIETVADILNIINQKNRLPDNILQAVNMDYAELTSPVKEGDEVAFFPPVTGG
jgi:molybdopterin synthase sulfur carrier subunit